ncbi:hypothetical protein LZ30DRAFT_483838 [Colletotrichum cereale]|nr:hypothetical protein LZ30DRAFT_483838 [Colletotrichum cereale]
MTALLATTCFSTKTTGHDIPPRLLGLYAPQGGTVNGSLEALLQVDGREHAMHREMMLGIGAGWLVLRRTERRGSVLRMDEEDGSWTSSLDSANPRGLAFCLLRTLYGSTTWRPRCTEMRPRDIVSVTDSRPQISTWSLTALFLSSTLEPPVDTRPYQASPGDNMSSMPISHS